MSLDIAVLTIGDELLNGEMPDTNTARIAQILGACGYSLNASLTVGDSDNGIENALLALSEKNDVVVVTGGLGPTDDDMTARAAAHAFGQSIMLNNEALEQIHAHFEKLGLEMHPRNQKQALLPQKAEVIPNPNGTAPGFRLQHEETDFFFLPGVPVEMEAMLEGFVLPRLQEREGGASPMQERVLKVFGLSEPKTEEMLSRTALPEGVSLAFGVEFPMVYVKLRAFGKAAQDLLDQAEPPARKALGDFVVASGKQTLAENVAQMFIKSGQSLSLAESCTGGLVSKMLTDIPGSSAFLERCGVTYANTAKQDWLGIPAEVIEKHGAVSESCALAMARGVRQASKTDVALAITGIAGPTGGTPQKPVGTVYIALSATEEEKVKGYRFGGDRDRVRKLAAFMALEWLRRYLCSAREKS